MNRPLLLIVGVLSLFVNISAAFEKSAPEAQGLSSEKVLAWIENLERENNAIHGFVLLRHNKLLAEGWWSPYTPDRPHMLYSLSKSFTSTAVGLAADEGLLSIDERVADIFPDKLPANPSENLKAMRIRDLLTMSTGNQNDTLPAIRQRTTEDWVSVFLAQPVEHTPGTFFRYNTGATYMLSAIVQKKSGKNLIEFLLPRLFAPLGIRNPQWEFSPQQIATGGYGLKVTTRDIAAFGQLYLQHGCWQGKQLLSSNWIAQATSKQVPNGDNPESDWNQGYGFQFWRCRNNAYRGDGAFGQYVIVIPEHDVVIAINSGLGDMQKPLNAIWRDLLPNLQPAPLAENPVAQAKLTEKLNALSLPTVAGRQFNLTQSLEKKYAFDANEKGLQSLQLTETTEGYLLKIVNDHGAQTIRCGYGKWLNGSLNFEKGGVRALHQTEGLQPIAASGAWTGDKEFKAQIYFRETPYRLDVALTFKPAGLTVGLAYNQSFGPKSWTLESK